MSDFSDSRVSAMYGEVGASTQEEGRRGKPTERLL
jgi:hypothetical protein